LKTPVLLLILDGWGHSDKKKFNAIANAKTPNWDYLWRNFPSTLIDASGLMVGLPKGQMGNSEVGHVSIGSGRIIHQDITRINESICTGKFHKNSVLNSTFINVKKSKNTLHVLGLLSTGGVHSHENHIFELINLAIEKGVHKICLHAFLDGRDTPPKSAKHSIQNFEKLLTNTKVECIIGSISGRYYAMDRDSNWLRTEKVYLAMVEGKGIHSSSALDALESAYSRGETDEFVQPTLISNKGNYLHKIEDNDVAIFMNFRSDRARQLTESFIRKDFIGFNRSVLPKIKFLTLTQYLENQTNDIVFPPTEVRNTLGEVLQSRRINQLRIAETEKYAHVTFFFNAGREIPFNLEDRILVKSPKVKTYDIQPEMSAFEVTKKLIFALTSSRYGCIICNYANADMVGHTGNYLSSIRAVEALDKCIGKVIEQSKKLGIHVFVTADHGNADQMVDFDTGEPHTAHTLNPVPFVYFGSKVATLSNASGKLSDISPTILELMQIDKPVEMTGSTIFKFN